MCPTHPDRPHLRCAYACALAAALLIGCGGGGGGGGGGGIAEPPPTGGGTGQSLTLQLPASGLRPADLAVIVAEGDALSEAVASAYMAARAVPAANLIRVKLDTGSEGITPAAFAALRADIEAKLPANVQATLLTWARPSRVEGDCNMGITSAMALGYDTAYCNPKPGTCTATRASTYFDSESRQPLTDLRMRPSMLLGPRTLAAAQALINRGVAADASLPPGEGWLVLTNDPDRNTRFSDMAPLPASWGSALKLNYLDNSAGPASANVIADKQGVLFYFTGLAHVDKLATLAFRPGALADTLTSVSGFLPAALGQTPVLDWLAAGVTASHGNVEEPCNFSQKFSKTSALIDHYWRGATAIEAYWKSVEWPGQGLFVGEPLAQPFRDAPSFAIVNGQYQIKTRNLRPGSRYTLQYLQGNVWTTLATFTGQRGVPLDARSALPPAAATQIRWVGPCADNVNNTCTLAASQ